MYAERSEAPDTEPHIFSAEELRGCSEGTCCHCGRCCVVFEIQIASDLIGEHTRRSHEQMEGICPYFRRTPNGRSLCEVHSQKACEPSLETCRGWSGDEGRYQDLLDETRTWIQQPRTLSDVETVRKWTKLGLLSDIGNFFRSPMDITICIAQYVVELGIIPDDVFAYIGLREAIAAMPPGYFMNVIVPRSGLNPALPLHASFLERYAPATTAPVQ